MLLKLGVDISRLNREIRRALNVIDRVFTDHDEDAVITSTHEGNHSPASLHYCNDAVDVRFPGDVNEDVMKSALKNSLGRNFDVVKETTHIHIEYDPK